MYSTILADEAEFDTRKHVPKVLAKDSGGDITVACWEPGQVSPYHCHPFATEIYFCSQGGGQMRTPDETIDIVEGSFVVHPPGEVHEYINGPQRTLLFRVRYGDSVAPRTLRWPTNPDWAPTQDDATYFEEHPID